MTPMIVIRATHHSDRSTIGSQALTVIHCNSDLSANRKQQENLNKEEMIQGIK